MYKPLFFESASPVSHLPLESHGTLVFASSVHCNHSTTPTLLEHPHFPLPNMQSHTQKQHIPRNLHQTYVDGPTQRGLAYSEEQSSYRFEAIQRADKSAP